MAINYRTGLAVAAGLMVLAVGAMSIHAAVTVPSTNVPKIILDNATVTSTLNFTVNGTTTDVDVANLNIQHTWNGDVEISLSRPGGALVLIFGDCGGSGDNFTNVTISDEGINPTCTASAQTGTLKGAPGGIVNPTVMTAFDGVASAGVWTLSIFDDAGGDTGTLSAWSVVADGAPPLPVELQKLEVK